MATDTGALIDPVSGLPYNVLNPTIDQFPYGGMPVAWDDLQIKGPRRTLYYPDDIPPVVATLEALNGQDTDNAQALHSDGQHRLLVASDTPIPVDIQSGQMQVNVTCNCGGGDSKTVGVYARILEQESVPGDYPLTPATIYDAPFDSSSFFDPANPTYLTIPEDGWYTFTLHMLGVIQIQPSYRGDTVTPLPWEIATIFNYTQGDYISRDSQSNTGAGIGWSGGSPYHTSHNTHWYNCDAGDQIQFGSSNGSREFLSIRIVGTIAVTRFGAKIVTP